MVDPTALALLDPSVFDDEGGEDNSDPRKKLIKMAAINTMSQLGAGGQDATATTATDEGKGDDTTEWRGAPPANPASEAGGDNDNAISKLQKGGGLSPMPSSFPADPAMSAAAGRLQKAQQPFQSQGIKSDLVRALLTAAPAAIGGGKGAGGAAEGANVAYQRNLQERSNAEQQYQFEAGREERERDQAIKERVAQANIETQRAYKTLLVAGTTRRNDIAQQRANTGQDAAAVNAAGKGLFVSKDAQGVSRVHAISPDDLTAVQQAQLGVDEATEELKKAQAAAIPQQIENAKKRLDNQGKMLQATLSRLEITKDNSQRAETTFQAQYGLNSKTLQPSDVPSRIPGAMQFSDGGGAAPLKVAGQLGPGGMEKSRAGAAQNASDTLKETAALIRANKDVLGPIWGRISLAGLAAGKVPDGVYTPAQRQALEKLAVSFQSSFSFVSTAHGWRSAEAPAKFEQAVGGLARDPEMTATGMETLDHNMGSVIKRGSTVRGSGGGGVSSLRKAAPSSAATPPANASDKPKIRSWKEFVNTK